MPPPGRVPLPPRPSHARLLASSVRAPPSLAMAPASLDWPIRNSWSLLVLCTSRAGSSPSSPGVPRDRVRLSPGLDSARVRSGLLAARGSWRLEGLGGRRRCVGTIVVPRAQLHTEQEKIFTGVVVTWRVGINQQYLYSSGEYLIFAWLFQRKKVTFKGILTAQDSRPGVP